jgi:hypothetical protein
MGVALSPGILGVTNPEQQQQNLKLSRKKQILGQ